MMIKIFSYTALLCSVTLCSCNPTLPTTLEGNHVNSPISRVSMVPGSVKQVLVTPARGEHAMAFYVPTEGKGIAQVVIERDGKWNNYFVKGISRGKTVGGIVPASTLDKSGFKVKDVANMARVQSAINANPTYITVK